jgi:hypothetical protein
MIGKVSVDIVTAQGVTVNEKSVNFFKKRG